MYGWPVSSRISAANRHTLAAPIAGIMATKKVTMAKKIGCGTLVMR